MQRCWLQGETGDALHALCCAVGYNLRWLMRAVLGLGLKGLLLCLFWLVYWARLSLMASTRAMPSPRIAPGREGFTLDILGADF